MEGLNKYLGTQALVTEACYVEVPDRFTFRPLGKFILKGFERAFRVYELCGSRESAPEFAELMAAFALGLGHSQTGNLAAARAAFLELPQRWPADGPTRFYLHTLDELAGKPPGPDGTGSIELKVK